MMKIAVKKAGEPIQFIETTEKYRTDCAKEFIGKPALVEFVALDETRTFFLAVDKFSGASL